MSLDSMKEIFDLMAQKEKPFWEIVLEAQTHIGLSGTGRS